MNAAIVPLLLALIVTPCHAKRAQSAKAEFQRLHPCPSTGERRGRCPGYVLDHVYPLCAGGPDTPANLQWQTIAAAKVKDQWEVRLCRHRLRPSDPLRYPAVTP